MVVIAGALAAAPFGLFGEHFIGDTLSAKEVVGYVARQLRHQLWVEELLGPGRAGEVRPLLGGDFALIAVVAFLQAFLAGCRGRSL